MQLPYQNDHSKKRLFGISRGQGIGLPGNHRVHLVWGRGAKTPDKLASPARQPREIPETPKS